MPTSIRFPSSLQIADREGHGDTFEEIRSAFEPEVGAVRRRNRMRMAPRIFNLQWVFTQDDFHTFDVWWQDTIRGGEHEFDVQLLDDDETLVWYTVRALGSYKAAIDEEYQWQVSLRVRTLSENFGTYRAPGTNELRGQTSIGVSKATAAIRIDKVLRGKTTVGLTASGRLTIPPLRGIVTVGMYQLPRAKFAVPSYSELSRQWQDLDWFGVTASQDIRPNPVVVQREWMGI